MRTSSAALLWALPLSISLGCNTVASIPMDATTPSADAAPDVPPADAAPDVPPRDAGPPAACSFNRDCPADQRCACANGDCACAVGARGAGRPGDPCASGDDCASSVCLDGPAGTLCSDACESPRDCPPTLPRCISVGGLGSAICVRDPGAVVDAGADAGAASSSLMATFGSRRGGFDRAQHGRAGSTGIYLEAHFGGDPACPTMGSPTPRRTLVISGVRTDLRGAQTDATGVRVTLLDFGGDLVSTPTARATRVELTPRDLAVGATVRFDLRATFAGGEITGSVDAPWCMSLDEP